MSEWKTLIAVVQLDRFKNCTPEELDKRIGELDSEHLKVEMYIKPNVLVFRTKNVEDAGKTFEQWLLSRFQKR